ncbi:substrate-binding periplasmic protein [Aquipseudomonas guryensis]|jgi:ABC-type amino acid transport substrate-binding protein|uniref:Transporter substrate-binding domain-containing protein n=1 Tax=Aquipseudomonas guryensis TaxID=2759165 RepID=A0A7W4DF86_9GAMM|nr:transporter substrate-binding domain-containing protein [Pseudomonas guryensis]MBB1521435.1 transporter substrate-binding domain-containing protein [Pseudomonas guryensis]
MPRLLALLALLCCGHLLAGERLVYPLHSSEDDPEAYVVELLRQALDKSGAGHQLVPSRLAMPQSRAQQSLEQNDNSVQLMWTMTTKEREQILLPVRIPIYKGLIGWRVALVREEDRHWLKSVRSLADLKPMRFGQRSDWPDTAILRSNGLQVVTSQSYSSLFRMLDAGRFDLFPREVVVAWDEQARANQQGLQLTVDEHVVLHYPTAFYFFTSRARADLAADIERGLERMIADGSFDQLFDSHHGATLRKAQLDKRQVIELKNPDLPELTPFAREELWYQPATPK